MEAESEKPPPLAWGRRLSSGAAFCCDRGWGAGQALEGFWRDVFAGAPSGARVLEIGCGSGEVSTWAAEAGRGLTVTASDLFDAADGMQSHPAVTFVGSAPAEALPFPAESFDLVVSNFAIEYAPREGALAELARVVRPGGSAVLVLHSADSVLTADSRAVLTVAEGITAADIPDRVRRAATLRPDHLTRRKLLKDVLKRKDEFPRPITTATGVEYFDLAERLLKGELGAREAVAELDRDVEMRLFLAREQARAALDAAALQEVAETLRTTGFAVQTSRLSYNFEGSSAPQMLAWTVFADRR